MWSSYVWLVRVSSSVCVRVCGFPAAPDGIDVYFCGQDPSSCAHLLGIVVVSFVFVGVLQREM